jgi:hypothetical protein
MKLSEAKSLYKRLKFAEAQGFSSLRGLMSEKLAFAKLMDSFVKKLQEIAELKEQLELAKRQCHIPEHWSE